MSNFNENVTLREHIDKFLHYVEDRGGFINDDLSLSKKAIAMDFLSFRSKILKRLHEEKKLTSADYQNLPCVELIKADPMKCPCQPPSGCIWLESKEIIPNFIAINSVTSTTGSKTFDHKKWNKFEDSLGGRSSMGDQDYYTFRVVDKGLRLIILGDIFLKNVTVDGLFHKPYEVCAFPNCGEQDLDALCNPLDQTFSFPSEYDDEICLSVFNKVVNMRRVALPDILNNDNDNG